MGFLNSGLIFILRNHIFEFNFGSDDEFIQCGMFNPQLIFGSPNENRLINEEWRGVILKSNWKKVQKSNLKKNLPVNER